MSTNIRVIKTTCKNNNYFLLNGSLGEKSKSLLMLLEVYCEMNKYFTMEDANKYMKTNLRRPSIMKELSENHYLIRTKERNSLGKIWFSYIVIENKEDYEKVYLEFDKKFKYYSDDEAHMRRIFNSMKFRCYSVSINNKMSKLYRYNDKAYNNLGGIRINKFWLNNPDNFIKWALENNYTEGSSIDRIDPLGDYAPWNCQVIPKSANSSKAFKDSHRSEAQIVRDKKIYFRRQHNWLKEMKAKGYSEEELI